MKLEFKSANELIKYYRENKKLTKRELAELLDITPQAIDQWEKGLTIPTHKHKCKLMLTLQIPWNYIHLMNNRKEPVKKFIYKSNQTNSI